MSYDDLTLVELLDQTSSTFTKIHHLAMAQLLPENIMVDLKLIVKYKLQNLIPVLVSDKIHTDTIAKCKQFPALVTMSENVQVSNKLGYIRLLIESDIPWVLPLFTVSYQENGGYTKSFLELAFCNEETQRLAAEYFSSALGITNVNFFHSVYAVVKCIVEMANGNNLDLSELTPFRDLFSYGGRLIKTDLN